MILNLVYGLLCLANPEIELNLVMFFVLYIIENTIRVVIN
jgi:hypothetical protein